MARRLMKLLNRIPARRRRLRASRFGVAKRNATGCVAPGGIFGALHALGGNRSFPTTDGGHTDGRTRPASGGIARTDEATGSRTTRVGGTVDLCGTCCRRARTKRAPHAGARNAGSGGEGGGSNFAGARRRDSRAY